MSTETESILKWRELTPFQITHVSQPVVINNDEFMVAAYKTNCSNGDGIYKFNTHKNEWIKIFDYDKDFTCNIYSAAYDNKNKLLYFCDVSANPSKMVTFDLKTKNKTTLKEEQYKRFFGLIFAENKLHQICNYVKPGSIEKNGDHYVYDKTKQFQKITTFPPFDNLHFYALFYLTVEKSILAFGGWKSWNINDGMQNSIYRFSFIDSKWKELNIKMPIKVARFGSVSTTNEQYIIILGGRMDGYVYSDDIFIYDIRNNIFIKSKIKCPKKGMYYAIMMNNSNRDEMTSFGFVNDCYKSNNFVGIQLLPHYLIQIICCYYCYEEIYLLKRGDVNDTGRWKVNVDDILQ